MTVFKNSYIPMQYSLLPILCSIMVADYYQKNEDDATTITILESLTFRIYLASWLVQKNYWKKCEEISLQIKIMQDCP